jgi:cytokinesis protein
MSDFGNLNGPPSRPSSATRPSSTATLKNDIYRYSAATVNKYAPTMATAASDLQDRLSHFHLPIRGQEEFLFPKPENPADIEAMFAIIKSTRDMPDTYDPPLEQKWAIVHSNEQLRWQEERARMTKRPGGVGALAGASISKDSPEWYLKKFMDMTITPKHVGSLAVSLRTLPIGCVPPSILSGFHSSNLLSRWLHAFIDLQGTSVLAAGLNNINRKAVNRKEGDTTLEHEILKCLRIILSHDVSLESLLIGDHLIIFSRLVLKML